MSAHAHFDRPHGLRPCRSVAAAAIPVQKRFILGGADLQYIICRDEHTVG